MSVTGNSIKTVNRCWTGVLRKLLGPMSRCSSHATGDVDVWLCLCVSGNQAHGVQTVGGRWKASLLDPESAATDLLWYQGQSE